MAIRYEALKLESQERQDQLALAALNDKEAKNQLSLELIAHQNIDEKSRILADEQVRSSAHREVKQSALREESEGHEDQEEAMDQDEEDHEGDESDHGLQDMLGSLHQKQEQTLSVFHGKGER